MSTPTPTPTPQAVELVIVPLHG
ncbi:hypothetical protein JL09_g6783 [Pichia kudriavzevii]|uniref:Uncharacterized protein n=1 Tax=Pichia kudriavzevii TaxID=4909 RepID=A0A099NJ53_PICKU|nr:hypothetical protein JL09_g6783 [Pichia kudriavzevii]